MKGQSKWESLREAMLNTGVAFLLSLLCQRFIVAPLQLQHQQAGGDLTDWLPAVLITIFYTGISLARNYFVRRFSNRRNLLRDRRMHD
ncbi:MAG: DUF7220 family protein [Pseudohongiellaceae bacterium]